MSQSLRRSLTRYAAVLVTALVGAGCARARPPGVAVRRIESNIVFGVKVKQPDVVPAALGADAGISGDGVTAGENSDTGSLALPSSPPLRQQLPPLGPPPKAACPQAAENAFPAAVAGLTVDHPPAAGVYRWKVVTPVSTGKVTSTVTQFVQHQIRSVSSVTSAPNPASPGTDTKTFTYDEAVLLPNGATTVSTYQVKVNAPQVNIDGVANTFGQNERAGAADRGVALVKSVQYGPDGKQTGVPFKPTTPLLLFPLDVITPESFSSVAVDPTSGASYANNAQVLERARVDACGDIIDGWKVVSTQTFTPTDGSPRIAENVTYYVAPQLGGLITYLAIGPADPKSQDVTSPLATSSIGQLHPAPLPPGVT